MATFTEGNLLFNFPDNWHVEKYDKAGGFYKKQFQKIQRVKAVDFIVCSSDFSEIWLLEVKDIRIHPRSNPAILWNDIAAKVRDTLAGMVAARCNADNSAEKTFFQDALCNVQKLHVVFHLEQQPQTNARRFPRAYNLSNVKKKLNSLVNPIDAQPKVVEIATSRGLPWQVTSVTPNSNP